MDDTCISWRPLGRHTVVPGLIKRVQKAVIRDRAAAVKGFTSLYNTQRGLKLEKYTFKTEN